MRKLLRNLLPHNVQCLGALQGRLGRVKFVLDVLRSTKLNQRTYCGTPIRSLPGDSTPLGAIKIATDRGGDEVHFMEEEGRS